MSNPREDRQDPMQGYQKLRVVGQGAFGIVYLCLRLADNAQVIMKQIPLEDMTAIERESALDEVKILSKLKHPNIIAHYDNFFDKTALIIVMEYAEGGTLLDFIQRRKDKGKLISEQTILQLFAQIVLSLSYIHSQSILHRDIKTSNIFLNKRLDVVKIGDFGISKILSSKSKAFSVIGTPSYISPELCENESYNQKTDIWALGCILYEMIALKKAFEARNLPALVLKIIHGVVHPIPANYSEDINKLTSNLLRRDPIERPSINEVMADPLLVNILMDLPMNIGRPQGIRVQLPAAGVSSIVPGRCRPTKTSLTSLSSYLEGEGVYDSKIPTLVYRWGGGLLKPTVLPLPKDDIEVIQVAIGRTLKAGVTSKGRLIVWETALISNDIPGSTMKEDSNSAIPRFIDGHAVVSIAQVSCGNMFIACVTDTGILMTFGNGVHGCLGHGNLVDVRQPKIVEELIDKQVQQVSCGAMHVMAVTADHAVFSWGKGDTGRLGHSNNELCHKPKHAPLPKGTRALYCFAGTDCSVVISHENKVLVCGGNRFNKLALNPPGVTNESKEAIEATDHLVAVTLKPLADLCIKYVALGISHSAFLTEKGRCYTCGSNSFGQLGYTRDDSKIHPRMVKSLEGKVINMITCGDNYTVAVTAENEIYTWGKGARGRLGTGNENDSTEPKLVDIQERIRVVSISSNKGTTLAVTKEVA